MGSTLVGSVWLHAVLVGGALVGGALVGGALTGGALTGCPGGDGSVTADGAGEVLTGVCGPAASAEG
ncbi:hypothetical protein ACLQ2S_23175 [Micromonospora sp. DT48]|uniref:hypothetical protein n=1 Tax=Micromonospora sp. DT48 TaxID=3393429 RepID=UPI003CEA50FB